MTKQFRLRACAALAVAAAMGLTGCGGGGSSTGLRLVGQVSDPAGAPVKGATVTAGAATATTDSSGRYELRMVAASSSLVVTFAGSGYNECVSVVPVTDRENTEQNVTLLPVGRSTSIDPSAATTVVDDRSDGTNGGVALPAGSVVSAAGAPLASARVKITTSVPGDAGYLDSFPAQYVGVTTRAAGEKVPLITYGAINVTLEDGAGQAAKLAGTAVLRFPVTAGNDPAVATIPLWYLDTTTGLWRSDSDAVRDETTTPATYKAEVSHFSWWAIAVFPPSSITVRVRVVRDPTDSPLQGVVGAQVTVRRERGAWQGRMTTDANGDCEVIAPPPGPYNVRARKANYFDEGTVSSTPGAGVVDVLYWLRPLGTGTGGG